MSQILATKSKNSNKGMGGTNLEICRQTAYHQAEWFIRVSFEEIFVVGVGGWGTTPIKNEKNQLNG